MRGKRNKWIKADDRADGVPIPHSGGSNQQLKGGFDARNRVSTTAANILKTPAILDRDPSRIKQKPAIPVSGSALPAPISHSGSKVGSAKMGMKKAKRK